MKHFVSFGCNQYLSALQKLGAEAEASGYFDDITLLTEDSLPESILTFAKENPRGFGYWIWKLFIIQTLLEKYPDGHTLIYADAGCGISTTPKARENFDLWIKSIYTSTSGRLSFEMTHPEENYTKADLFDLFDACPSFRKTGQRSASIQVYKVSKQNREFVTKMIQTAILKNNHYITDAPSVSPNAPTFQDHRHDQSILSLMMKTHGSFVFRDHWKDPDYPIMTLRRRS